MKKKFFLIITIFLILFIPLVISEIYLRFIGLGNPVTYNDNYVYGYAPKANQKKQRFKNSTVTINDAGLRAVHNWANNKNKKKIIFFGDSVTYGGSYIDDNELFSELTCDNLENENYICGNAGVNAYGIFNIVFRSRYDTRLNDDYLRIFLLVPDDFYRGLQDHNTAHFYLNESKLIFNSLLEAVNFFATKYNLKNFISKRSDNIKRDNQLDIINESIRILDSELKRLRKQQKKFLIFYTPSNPTNELNNYIFKQINKIISFEVIDLSSHLKKDMFEDSIHYNKKGHVKVSEIMSKKILEFLK